MTKSPSRTSTRNAVALTSSSPMLTKREKQYKKARALVMMAKSPDLMSPKAAAEYHAAQNIIMEYEAAEAADKRGLGHHAMNNTNEMNTKFPPRSSPYKKTVSTRSKANRVNMSPENHVLSPPKHRYPGITQNAVHYNSAHKTVEYEWADYGNEDYDSEEEEEDKAFYSPNAIVSYATPKTHHPNNGHPKNMFPERHSNDTEIDEEWELWKRITWKYATEKETLVLGTIAYFCIVHVICLFMFTRALF